MTASSPGAALTCARLTRALALVLVLNAFVLSGVLWLVAPNREIGNPPVALNETVLQHTWDLLHARGGDDSWGIISAALDYAQKPHTTPLYTEIFFNRQIKFQYPPTALFAVAGMRLIDPTRIRIGDYYQGPRPTIDDMLGLFFIAMLALATAALLELRLRQTGAFAACDRLIAVRVVLVIAFALTFYPAVKAFTLGQIQVWINGVFALALLCFLAGRKAASGALLGLICLMKPHYGVFLLWAGLRREWRFAAACAVVGVIGLVASIAAFGLADHLDYLRTLSFMSQHGEGYYPNQSVNGLLNRLMSITEPRLYANLEFFPDRFPPFNPWVYGGTMIATVVVLAVAQFPLPILLRARGREGWGQRDCVIDFCIMAVSATIASPIAWEHHYGILLPVFAVLLATAPVSRGRLTWLALSYVLASAFIPAANLLAPTVLNPTQSYLLVGAVTLLVLLHTWRASPNAEQRGAPSGVNAKPIGSSP